MTIANLATGTLRIGLGLTIAVVLAAGVILASLFSAAFIGSTFFEATIATLGTGILILIIGLGFRAIARHQGGNGHA